MSGAVIFYGDPHGDWKPLLRACQDERPDGVVILGDCDLEMPLRHQLKPLFDAGVRVRWIPGNHDKDNVELHDRLWMDYPDGNLHARRSKVGGMIVAGLGGVFREKVWYPRFEMTAALHADRRSLLRSIPTRDRWRGGLPLGQRDAIFPADIHALRRLRADVLVSHEAPSCHRHGFVGIDEAATACRARLVIHGHHHQDYSGVIPDTGVQVRGLGRAQVFRLRPGDLA